VLAAIRRLNRLENVAEHLRAALNAIATIEPDWLAAWVPMVWFDRYARRIEDFRLPQDKAERTAYAEQTGHDGRTLLQALYHADAPRQLRDLPTVQALRMTWIHQFVTDDGKMHLRDAKDLPPSRQRNASPYDDQARHSLKRSISWTGYKVHYSETCDTNAPHLITHMVTTDATVTDVEMTAATQNALIRADLAPREHLLDTGYINAQLLTIAAGPGATELVGPIRPDRASAWTTSPSIGTPSTPPAHKVTAASAGNRIAAAPDTPPSTSISTNGTALPAPSAPSAPTRQPQLAP
jgi:transposase